MLKTSKAFSLILGFSLAGSVVAAAPVNKCLVNGTTTYQQGPCAPEATRRLPTVQKLNADEQRRGASTVAAPPSAVARPEATVQRGFSCDGRKYCSQMKSCAEAKYFLSHCPAVKMDGDKNGIPCEQQWCMR